MCIRDRSGTAPASAAAIREMKVAPLRNVLDAQPRPLKRLLSELLARLPPDARVSLASGGPPVHELVKVSVDGKMPLRGRNVLLVVSQGLRR